MPVPVFFGGDECHEWFLEVLNRGQVFQAATPSRVKRVGNLSEGNILFFWPLFSTPWQPYLIIVILSSLSGKY